MLQITPHTSIAVPLSRRKQSALFIYFNNKITNIVCNIYVCCRMFVSFLRKDVRSQYETVVFLKSAGKHTNMSILFNSL